jgi:N-methylhydantoinase A
VSASSRYALGIDIGGTFTDVAVFDADTGRQHSRKILTTHGDPAQAVLQGVREIIDEFSLDTAAFARMVHATTLFTNALIERKGAVTGLITTAGFSDVLEIGRERKYELYDLAIKKPAPLAPRDLRREVAERIDASGAVRAPLDEQQLLAAARELVQHGVESLAVVFLHAYLNPLHEQRALALLAAEFPGLHVTASHEVAPEIREFERASTAVANAYVKPLAARYLDALAERVRALGIDAELALMISSGGLTHRAQAKRVPVQMLESGPAAGALAAAFFGSEDAGGHLLAFDMGGTTAKLSLVDDGEPLTAYGFEAARQKRFIEHSGLPIRISTIELIEIGAGGGSIAAPDRLGLIKVGPRSAGSEPGPAAYGRGGTDATVTDADFMLGYLNPDYFAGGSLQVDLAACEQALERTAAQVGLTAVALAWGIHDIVNENMASAARVHIAERGRDPSDYALLCTGGAGPVHAYYLARKLRINRVLCPPAAGVASALGLLVAPARVDRVATLGFRLDRDPLERLEAAFVRLEEEAAAVFAEGGLDGTAASMGRLVDGRFIGQGYDLTVRLPAGPYDRGDAAAQRARLQEAFEAAYREKYQRTPRDVPLEFINVRLAAQLPLAGEALRFARETGDADPLKGRRRVYWEEAGDYVETPVLDRARVAPGVVQQGPAVIEEEGSTLVVGPSGRFQVLASGNLQIDIVTEGEGA